MKEQFATYEVSKQLKELGYNEECYGYYFDKSFEPSSCAENSSNPSEKLYASAPLWQQVKQWLWEKNKIKIDVYSIHNSNNFFATFSIGQTIKGRSKDIHSPITAEIEGIKKAVEHLHKQL